MKRLLWLCAALIVTVPAQARMYQWVSAQTGRTQLSGKPPAWYRSDQSGPRILVFENGRLVDDTARPVSLEERAALRAQAFARIAEQGTQLPADADMPSPAAVSGASEAGGAAGVADSTERTFGESDTSEAKARAASAEAPDATIARLKSIIDAWEQQQTEEAKRLLEQSAVLPPASSGERGATTPAANPGAAPTGATPVRP